VLTQQPAKAREHSRQAVELAPDDPGVLTHAASHMEAMYEHELAERWVREAQRARLTTSSSPGT